LTTRADVASGYLKRANTLEALAEEIKISPQALKTTVERYNEYAERGEDPMFGRGSNIYQRHLGDAEQRPNPCLAPINEAPFYAIAVRPADLGMSAGIVTDTQARVVRSDGSAIDGLYACGNDMASVMEGAYPGPGITLGPALTFGWLAGRSAAAQGRG
jgi:predicted oxidoreductase